jgi:hypothetical protein
VHRILISKLERLEDRLNAIRSVRDPIAENIASDLVCDQIREYLLRAGIEQTDQESLAGACARYLGVNGRQLQRLLIESCYER